MTLNRFHGRITTKASTDSTSGFVRSKVPSKSSTSGSDRSSAPSAEEAVSLLSLDSCVITSKRYSKSKRFHNPHAIDYGSSYLGTRTYKSVRPLDLVRTPLRVAASSKSHRLDSLLAWSPGPPCDTAQCVIDTNQRTRASGL